MEAYGIDGVAVQRFLPGASPDPAGLRVLNHIRAAANLTGRTYFLEYDMSGVSEAELVPTITRDWHYLVDTMMLTSDSRYLHQGGLPVIGIFGFFEERFGAATANAILDIFKGPGPYQAFVAGAGAWYWNTQPYSDEYKEVIYRMGSWQPWNVGNSGGGPTDVPSTHYWDVDSAALAAHGVMYVPQIYPGSSGFNRERQPWGPAHEDRQSGTFLWSQVVKAHAIDASSVFLGMFDEIDEGSQILKVSSTPPGPSNFRDYQGLPSDAYLCFTGEATKMLRGEIPFSATKPDCAAKTQPTIPDPVEPLSGASLSDPDATFNWTAALALDHGGTISGYEVWLDGAVTPASTTSAVLTTTDGTHVWRARALNSLGNAGGWSVAQTFSVSRSSGAGGNGGKGGSGPGTSASGSGGASGEGGDSDPSNGDDDSCSCDVPGRPSSGSPVSLVSLFTLLALARRRRNAT